MMWHKLPAGATHVLNFVSLITWTRSRSSPDVSDRHPSPVSDHEFLQYYSGLAVYEGCRELYAKTVCPKSTFRPFHMQDD